MTGRTTLVQLLDPLSRRVWVGAQPDMRRAIVGRLLDTRDSARIDAGIAEINLALTPAVNGAGNCASGFCSSAPVEALPDNGRVPGIDGVLDQISGALMRQARVELLPALKADPAIHDRIGRAVGREIARPTWVIAVVTCVGLAARLVRGV